MVSKAEPQEVYDMLKKQGISVKKSELFDYAFSIDDFDRLQDVEALKKGYIQVQDFSSILAGHIPEIKRRGKYH